MIDNDEISYYCACLIDWDGLPPCYSAHICLLSFVRLLMLLRWKGRRTTEIKKMEIICIIAWLSTEENDWCLPCVMSFTCEQIVTCRGLGVDCSYVRWQHCDGSKYAEWIAAWRVCLIVILLLLLFLCCFLNIMLFGTLGGRTFTKTLCNEIFILQLNWYLFLAWGFIINYRCLHSIYKLSTYRHISPVSTSFI